MCDCSLWNETAAHAGRDGIKRTIVPFADSMCPVSSGFELGWQQCQVAIVRPWRGRRKHPFRYSMSWVPACEEGRSARPAVAVGVIVAQRDTLLRHPGEPRAADLGVHVQRRRTDVVVAHVVHYDEDHVRPRWLLDGCDPIGGAAAEQRHCEQQSTPRHLLPISREPRLAQPNCDRRSGCGVRRKPRSYAHAIITGRRPPAIRAEDRTRRGCSVKVSI